MVRSAVKWHDTLVAVVADDTWLTAAEARVEVLKCVDAVANARALTSKTLLPNDVVLQVVGHRLKQIFFNSAQEGIKARCLCLILVGGACDSLLSGLIRP